MSWLFLLPVLVVVAGMVTVLTLVVGASRRGHRRRQPGRRSDAGWHGSTDASSGAVWTGDGGASWDGQHGGQPGGHGGGHGGWDGGGSWDGGSSGSDSGSGGGGSDGGSSN